MSISQLTCIPYTRLMAYQDEFLSIQTPENIVFGYEVAGVGTRFIAAAIDTILLVVVLIVTGLATTFFLSLAGAESLGGGWVVGIYSVLSFVILWGYYVVFELVWTGQSPGKRYMGLRVIGRDGTPVGVVASLIRNFVRLIDFVPAFYGLGVIAMFASRQVRRLGDFAAGTLVVFDKNVSLANLARTVPAQLGTYPKEAMWYPVERLAEQDVALAESWLARRHELATERQLLRPILQRLYSRMELELEERLAYEVAVSRLELIVGGYRNR